MDEMDEICMLYSRRAPTKLGFCFHYKIAESWQEKQ